LVDFIYVILFTRYIGKLSSIHPQRRKGRPYGKSDGSSHSGTGFVGTTNIDDASAGLKMCDCPALTRRLLDESAGRSCVEENVIYVAEVNMRAKWRKKRMRRLKRKRRKMR
jgi:hypothetical protein